MKYRVEIYDLEYKVTAKSEEGAVRGALARYAQTASADRRHGMLARVRRRHQGALLEVGGDAGQRAVRLMNGTTSGS